MSPKLAWVQEFVACLNRATDGDIRGSHIEDVADPLTKMVVLEISSSWSPKNYKAFQALAHGFAKANDCVLARIHRRPKAYVLEVLIKTRFGPKMNKNPLG